jgi:hypothetical protein
MASSPLVPEAALKTTATREIALFLVLLLAGIVAAPIGIYLVGQQVFGEFGGYGYADFYGTLSAKIRGGEAVAWFFVLSPYLLWQTVRLTRYGWHRSNSPTT